jgi:hypothetical protein
MNLRHLEDKARHKAARDIITRGELVNTEIGMETAGGPRTRVSQAQAIALSEIVVRKVVAAARCHELDLDASRREPTRAVVRLFPRTGP